jgi:hypothetical protein
MEIFYFVWTVPLDIKTYFDNAGEDKAFTVTGCGGPWGCWMSRLPRVLDNWLIDGSGVVSLMHRPPLIRRKMHHDIELPYK